MKNVDFPPSQAAGGPRYAVPAILVFGLALDLIGIIPIADHWTNMAYLLMEGREIGDAFKPLYIPEAVVYALRPLAFTALKILWSFFGPTDWALNFVKGLTLPLFGWAAYSLMAGFGDRKAAFWSALAAMLLPPILYSGWLIGEFDILGAACIYLGILYIDKLSEGRGSSADWVLFALFAFLSACTKETTAAFFLVFYLSYLFYRFADRRTVRPWHFIVAAAYAAGIFLIFLPMSKVPTYMGSLEALRPPVSFIVVHNFIQVYYLIGAAGTTAMLFALYRLWFQKDVTAGPAWPLAPALCLALLAFPVTVTYSHYEATFFDPLTAPQLYGFVLVFCLAGVAFLGRREKRLFSLMTFGCLVPGSLSPILLTFSRDDVSSRIYTLCAPLLVYLAVSFLTGWRSEAASLPRGLRRGAALASFWTLSILFGWFFVAAGFNFAMEYRARILAEFDLKRALSERPLENSIVYFNNFPYQVGEADILVARGKRHTLNLSFQLLETQNEADDPASIEAKICRYLGTQGDASREAYYYWLSPKSEMNARANERLAGDFSWTETGAYPFLRPIVFNRFDSWSYGPIRNHRAGMYRTPSTAEKMLKGKGEEIYASGRRYVQLPTWPYDAPARIVSGVPLVERYRYDARLFKLNVPALNCVAPEPGG